MRRQPLLSEQRVAAMGVSPPSPPRSAPVLNPFGTMEAPMPPAPFPGASTTVDCEAMRVQLAGGALNSLIVDPSVVPFEQLYRRLPEEGMFSEGVNPDNPFAFELGAFTVPDGFALLLFDLRPDIYRFSGIDAGDYIPVESRRFASRLGFQITVDQRQPGNLHFELDPIAIQSTQNAFTQLSAYKPATNDSGTNATPESVFNQASSNSFASAGGAGKSLQPQRPTRYGPLSVPFTLHVRAHQTVQLRCIVFHPLPSPIAFIEYDMAGLLVPTHAMDQMIRCMAPDAGGSASMSRRGGPR